MQIAFYNMPHGGTVLPDIDSVSAAPDWGVPALHTLRQETKDIQQHFPALLDIFTRQDGELIIAKDTATYKQLVKLPDSAGVATRSIQAGERVHRRVVINAETYKASDIDNLLAHELAHQADDNKHGFMPGMEKTTLGGILSVDILSGKSNLFTLCADVDMKLLPDEQAKTIKRILVNSYPPKAWPSETFAYAVGMYVKNPQTFASTLLKSYIEHIAIPYVTAKSAGNRQLCAAIASRLSLQHAGMVLGEALNEPFAAWRDKANALLARDEAKAQLLTQADAIRARVTDYLKAQVPEAQTMVNHINRV